MAVPMSTDKIAAGLELTPENYSKLVSEIVGSQITVYTTGDIKTRVLQAEEAAAVILANLAHFHYKIIDPD